ncbi:hypothetical protein Tco_0912942 [Tanacetum coccineum]
MKSQDFNKNLMKRFTRHGTDFNDLLRGMPHHGFQDCINRTFYNSLNSNDQDSLNSAAGGNFLDKMPRECLKIIESKSKVRQSRSKAIVSKVSTSSSTPAVSSDVAELKDMVRALILDKKNHKLSSTPVKSSRAKLCNLRGVVILTKIVQPPMATFIVTISKNTCHKPPQLTTTKGMPVTDLRWLLTKFDLPVFLLCKTIKTTKIGGSISTKIEGTI